MTNCRQHEDNAPHFGVLLHLCLNILTQNDRAIGKVNQFSVRRQIMVTDPEVV